MKKYIFILGIICLLCNFNMIQGNSLDVESNSTHGPYLVDEKGMSLYMFERDTPGKSNCFGNCAKVWPPLTQSSGPIKVSGNVKQSLVGYINRSDGLRQVTYSGFPLYTYIQDAPHETKGQGINESGGLWWLMSPNGSPNKKQ
jgi:predicted lipoprotein with Yx(FWY)xxD motif